MKNFVVGFVVAVVSIVSAVLIFVGKLVRRGVRTMPRSTKDYIKSQFKFIDIHKMQDAVACSIKAFIDWAMYGRQRSVYDNAYEGAGPKDSYKSWYKAQKRDEKETHPEPYIMDVEEYGCGYFTKKVRYDVSNDKLYDKIYYDDTAFNYYKVTGLDFIKDLIKNDDPTLMEVGTCVYIHSPRTGGDYEVEIVDGITDDVDDKDFS